MPIQTLYAFYCRTKADVLRAFGLGAPFREVPFMLAGNRNKDRGLLTYCDGSAVFSNRAMHDMLGYTGEELSHFEKWDEISLAKFSGMDLFHWNSLDLVVQRNEAILSSESAVRANSPGESDYRGWV